MSTAKPEIRNKHLRLDQGKIRRAQRALGARTETETIERALDFLLDSHAQNRAAWAAHRRFLREAIRGGVEIRDVYGALEE